MSGLGKDSAKKDPNSPATTTKNYDIMQPRLDLMNTVLGGTEDMREAGETYLPKHPAEDDEAYRVRLGVATLYPKTEKTSDELSAKPFTEELQLKDDIPDAVRDLMQDVDLQGNAIGVFCRTWFATALTSAFSHVLVEFPRKEDLGRPQTLADDREAKARPYLVHIPPENVLGMEAEVVNGQERLTRVRIREYRKGMKGFAETSVERIRILTPGHVQIMEQPEAGKKKGKWKTVEEYDVDMQEIPMVTFYTHREDLCLGKSPLQDLAYLNITHWQSTSDQRNALTVARFPMLACSGYEKEVDPTTKQPIDPVMVGPRQFLTTMNPQGRFYYVEPQGAAIKAGANDILELEQQMALFGAQFMRKESSVQTATQSVLDTAEANSPLQAWTIKFEDAVAQVLGYMARWLNLEGEGGGHINLDKSASLENATDAELSTLDKSRARHDMSREAHLGEMKRRGILAESFDIEADQVRIDNEMRSLAALEIDLLEREAGAGSGGDNE